MAQFNCEIFGVVVYSPELEYQELYEHEEHLTFELQNMLEGYNVDHLDFWGAGDSLQFQFVLEDYDAEQLTEIAQEVADILTEATTGRMLALDRNLKEVTTFILGPQTVDEKSIQVDG